MLLAACSPVFAQNPQLQTRNGRQFPTLVFTAVSWSAEPSYYSIAIDSTGTATYQSAPETVGRTGVPYTLEFHVTDRTRRAVFNLARNMDFLREVPPVSLGAPENSVVHTMTYVDPGFRNQITYSSSTDPNLEEITSILEEISETLEFGRRLTYSYEHDRSALGRELNSAPTSSPHYRPRELHSLTPALSRIAADPALSAEIRSRADVLLRRARAER